MSRKKVSPTIEADVLTRSRRWCALCYGLQGLRQEKRGQIAHINKNSSDSKFDNLVFLCIDHHDQYDSKTSQSKNYTQAEVRKYRDQIYAESSARNYSESEINTLREYIRTYSEFFEYLFYEYDDIAISLDSRMLEIMGGLRDTWWTSSLRSFNQDIQTLQDEITRLIVSVRGIYEIHMYDGVGSFIIFDNGNFGKDILDEKKKLVRSYIEQISDNYLALREIASLHS